MPKDQTNICHSKTFEAIYKTHSKALRRFIFFKTKNKEQTEDILQDTFVKLWDHCAKVSFDKVKSYLFTIASNTFLNMIKHYKVKEKHHQHFEVTQTNESPEFILIEKEFMRKLEHTIDGLPNKQKEVFLLNRIEKRTYKEIAAHLNISVKAVEKRMHLALLVMRREIGDI
ncbi:MAG: RNA polymerase sigma-70 factor [Psychroserpens sp.]|uniref:RNA polymerase sigma factor n=1 Tax=Psychroserpens sp. TaxID=2020870 RepID=UPI003C8E6835